MDNNNEDVAEQKMESNKKYFKINKQSNTMLCMQCGRYLCGIRVNNMKRHYQAVHRINIDCKRNKGSPSDNEVVENAEPVIENPQNQNTVSVEVDKNKFMKCCVGLFAVEDYPLELFDDKEFFKILISPFERKYKTDITSASMQTTLKYCSTKIRAIISKRLKHKLISLKLDMAPKKDTSMLDISVQLISQDFKIHTNSLGMIQLQKKTSWSILKKEVLKCLADYNIDIRHIYSITTDDGADVTEISKLLRELQENQSVKKEPQSEHSSADESLEEESSQVELVPVLSDIKCAAHLIKLAANDVLGTLELNINDCRSVAKKVRAYLQEGEHELEMPVLDDNSCWISTYEMLKSLLRIRQFIDTEYFESCKSHYDMSWEFVIDFQASFEPLVNFTEKVFTEQYIIGDFYRDWLECELELEELGATTTYGSQLHLAMEHRKSVLLQNEAFLAALYLDPRFNFQNSVMLTEKQKDSALLHLLKTFEVMIQLKSFKQEPNGLETSANPADELDEEMPSTSEAPYSRLEQRMNRMMAVSATTTITETKRAIKQKLILFGKNSFKVLLNTDVLEYWKIGAFDNDLRKLAEVVLAVPVTKVSTENASTSVDSTITKLKTKLSNQALNNLILTKLNFKLINSSHTKIEFALDFV